MQNNQIGPLSHTILKTNSKCIKELLDVRVEMTKLLKENLGVNVLDLEVGTGFLGMTPKAQATKENI